MRVIRETTWKLHIEEVQHQERVKSPQMLSTYSNNQLKNYHYLQLVSLTNDTMNASSLAFSLLNGREDLGDLPEVLLCHNDDSG